MTDTLQENQNNATLGPEGARRQDSLERVRELATKPVGKLLFKYSLPAVVGTVVMAIYHIIDSMVIGHAVADPNVVTGIAVTFPVTNIATAFGMLVGTGAATRVSIVMGQKDMRAASLILGNSVLLTLFVGLFYTLIFGLFIDPILLLFGASPASLPYAREFVLWFLPGMVLINFTFSYNNVMRASGYPTKAMWTSLIGAVLNSALAPLFLFCFGWGVRGAALATDISMLVTAVFVMQHFFDRKHTLHFEKGTFRIRWKVVAPILYIGMAPFLINLTGSGINAIVNFTLGKYGGDNAIASVVVFNRFVTIFIFIVIGICQGMQPILGYNYGARKYSRLFSTFKLAALWSVLFTTLGSITGALAPGFIASMFMTDPEHISVAVNCLRITTLTFWMVGFQIVCTNFFQSLGMAGKAVFLSLTRQIIFMIPLLFTLPLIWQLDGVWMSYPISDAISTLVAGGMLWWQIRVIRREPAPSPVD